MEQADGTAWMGMYCTTMLAMALELARENPAYEDIASKFFEHFVDIADALNSLGGTGLWDEQDGFYYDHLRADGFSIPMRLRSLVGFVPLLAVEVIDDATLARVPAFAKRMEWFLTHRSDLRKTISQMEVRQCNGQKRRLLALPSTDRLRRALTYLLNENEFLSPCGIRSMSKYYQDHPYVFNCEGQQNTVRYSPGDSETGMFGGNSNWRGPVWFPLNYLLLEALERYHHFYGESFRVEFPTGSGKLLDLDQVAHELGARLLKLFLPDAQGRRPCFGQEMIWTDDPHWRKLLLFHEFFHGDSGAGIGRQPPDRLDGTGGQIVGRPSQGPCPGRPSRGRCPLGRPSPPPRPGCPRPRRLRLPESRRCGATLARPWDELLRRQAAALHYALTEQ